MLRDAALEGATATEVVALARLAKSRDEVPPAYLCDTLRAKGWMTTTPSGDHLLTSDGKTLLDKLS